MRSVGVCVFVVYREILKQRLTWACPVLGLPINEDTFILCSFKPSKPCQFGLKATYAKTVQELNKIMSAVNWIVQNHVCRLMDRQQFLYIPYKLCLPGVYINTLYWNKVLPLEIKSQYQLQYVQL